MTKKTISLTTMAFAIFLLLIASYYFFKQHVDSAELTTLDSISGYWKEPEGVTGVGTLTIDGERKIVSYSSSDAEMEILGSEIKNGWLILHLYFEPESWSTTLKIKKLDDHTIRCIDDVGRSGQVRERVSRPRN